METPAVTRWHRATTAARSVVLAISGAVFLAFGAWKVSDLTWFSRVVTDQGVIAPAWAWTVAAAVGVAEIGLGLWGLAAACSGRGHTGSLASLSLAFGVLAAYAAWLMLHPPTQGVACGCGMSREPVRDWSVLVIRNGVASAFLAGLAVMPGPFPRARRDAAA